MPWPIDLVLDAGNAKLVGRLLGEDRIEDSEFFPSPPILPVTLARASVSSAWVILRTSWRSGQQDNGGDEEDAPTHGAFGFRSTVQREYT